MGLSLRVRPEPKSLTREQKAQRKPGRKALAELAFWVPSYPPLPFHVYLIVPIIHPSLCLLYQLFLIFPQILLPVSSIFSSYSTPPILCDLEEEGTQVNLLPTPPDLLRLENCSPEDCLSVATLRRLRALVNEPLSFDDEVSSHSSNPQFPPVLPGYHGCFYHSWSSLTKSSICYGSFGSYLCRTLYGCLLI